VPEMHRKAEPAACYCGLLAAGHTVGSGKAR
jgi:hypothetical protein